MAGWTLERCRILLAAAALSGCSSATPTVQGDQLLSVDPCASGGSTWTELYGCYFGPTGKASCSGLGWCHGSPSFQGGGAFLCGTSKDECYTAFTTFGAQSVVHGWLRPEDPSTCSLPCDMPCNPYPPYVPATGTLTGCDPEDGGAMYTFTPEDFARLDDWLGKGAPNN